VALWPQPEREPLRRLTGTFSTQEAAQLPTSGFGTGVETGYQVIQVNALGAFLAILDADKESGMSPAKILAISFTGVTWVK